MIVFEFVVWDHPAKSSVKPDVAWRLEGIFRAIDDSGDGIITEDGLDIHVCLKGVICVQARMCSFVLKLDLEIGLNSKCPKSSNAVAVVLHTAAES